MKFRDLQGSLTSNELLMTAFEFIGQFFFKSKMMFLNSKKSFQTMGSELTLRSDLEVSRHFLLYRFETNQR
jgi:hypothetical protein